MDFQNLTVATLLPILPEHEDNRWEYKSARLLSADDKHLGLELGKQVSALANSGGGNLVFGIDDKTRAIEDCGTQFRGRPLKDILVSKVASSVDYPLSQFSVHQIPFEGDSSKAIFVISIDDSAAAPHMAKREQKYYFRRDGQSVPAPHFHLELLRNRTTRAVLEVKAAKFEIELPMLALLKNCEMTLCVAASIEVTNISSLIASPCALRVWQEKQDSYWFLEKLSLGKGSNIKNSTGMLFPHEHDLFQFTLACPLNEETSEVQTFLELLQNLEFSLRPVSHNYAGAVRTYRPSVDLLDGGAGRWPAPQKLIHGV